MSRNGIMHELKIKNNITNILKIRNGRLSGEHHFRISQNCITNNGILKFRNGGIALAGQSHFSISQNGITHKLKIRNDRIAGQPCFCISQKGITHSLKIKNSGKTGQPRFSHLQNGITHILKFRMEE